MPSDRWYPYFKTVLLAPHSYERLKMRRKYQGPLESVGVGGFENFVVFNKERTKGTMFVSSLRPQDIDKEDTGLSPDQAWEKYQDLILEREHASR